MSYKDHSSVELAHTVTGAGSDAVVLLHSLALDRGVWPESFISALGATRTVVACDLPGHGASALDGASSIEDMADRVAALIGVLGLSKVAVIGLSMGGCTAQALAIRHPHLLRGLALLDTTAWYGPDAPETWAKRAKKARVEGFDSLATFQVSRWLSEDFRERHPEVVEMLLQTFKNMDYDSYEVACEAMGQVDLRADLPRIGCPTAVAVGENDYATPLEFATLLADSIPGATLTVVPAVRHLSVVENPAAVLEAVRAVV